MWRWWLLWLSGLGLALGCEGEDPIPGLPEGEIPNGPVCDFDESAGPETALPLPAETPVFGALCPVEDRDWYALSVPPGEGLLRVALAMNTPLSPVEPVYAVHRRTPALPVVASPGTVGVGQALDLTHCVAPGDYWLVVRDQGDDAQDRRNQYTLQVSTAPDPDPQEPDGSPELARVLAAGAPAEGRLACRSDEDWFRLTVGAEPVLRLRLSLPVAQLQPRLRVLTAAGETLLDEVNRGAARAPTDLARTLVIRDPGDVFVVVSDDDGVDSDPEVSYRLEASLGPDRDLNEPNDRAAEATALMGLDCGGAWSEWRSAEGTLAAPGDPDWFRLPLTGCGRGLIEAELSLDEAGLSAAQRQALQAELQLALGLVLAQPDSRCASDAECRTLSLPCDSGWDCAGFGNVCAAEGRCAGASACTAEGRCGGLRVERRHQPAAGDGPAAHVVRLSAPLDGQRVAYLRVSDVGADGADPSRLYQLRVRVRQDPDAHEPSNRYAPNLLRSDPMDVQVALAVARNRVPVHLCGAEAEKGEPLDGGLDRGPADQGPPDARPLDLSPPDLSPPDLSPPDLSPPDLSLDLSPPDLGPPDLGPPDPPPLVPGCCGPDDWIEGAIGYQGDQDWYVYAHPCPGADCMVRIRYQIDGGPVDPYWQVYRADTLWFDTVIPVEELAQQPARQGSFGGLAAQDQCFYAFQGHRGRGEDPFYYALRIRDLLPAVDWAPDQRYRFCVERIAEGCQTPPCARSPNGECDTP